MKKDSPSLLLRVSRTFKFHFWDNLMAASHLGLRGLLRLCSGRRRRRRPAAKPWWNGRYLPTMEMLELRLQPATLPTFYPTGVDNSSVVLGTGVTDPHYAIVARPSPLTDTTSRTVTPATGWLANSSISRWITPTSSGYQGVNIGGYYTYRTTLDFTGYDPDSIVLSGYWAVDDFAVITVNGSGTPSAAVYYPGWSSWHTFTLNSSNSSFVNGPNDIDFIVGNYYGSTGLRVGVVTVQANALPVITDLDVDPIDEGQTATLNGSFTDEESGQSHTVDIDWGDGSSPTTLNLPAGTTTFSPTHVYADGGNPYTTYTITVDVTDSDGAAAIPDTTTIDVDNVDPTATNDTLSIYTGTTKAEIRVLANDSDPANTGSVHDPLTITSVSTPTHGTATWNDNGTSSDPMDDWIDYEPTNPSYTGTDSFTYNIDDGDGGTSTATVTVTYEALPVIANTPAVSNADPMQGTMKSFGAASFSLYNGNVRVGVPLRIDTSVADSALVYNSQSVQPRPIIQIKQPTLTVNGVPAQIQTQLTWWPDPSSYPSGGVQQGWVTVGTGGHSAGDTYLLAAQVATPVSPTTSGTNYYNWRFDINITLANGTVLMRSVPGKTEVVVNDNSPFGAGWSIAGLDRLVPVTDGVLYVYGAGGAQFFAALGGGAYASLDDENRGTLVKHGDDTFTYWTPLQDRYDFDTGGLLMQISDANGTTSFTYESSSTRVSTITTPAGGVATFVYSGGTPVLTQIQLPGGRNLGATISSGDLTVASYPDSSLRSFTYDGSHRLTNDRTGTGGWNVTYTYDTGSINSGALTGINAGGGVTKTVGAAMPRGLATAPGVNASAGVGTYANLATYTFDGRGRVLQETANSGGVQSWTRNTDGQPATYTDALGHTTSYSYNGDGDLLTVTAADGGVTTYTYAGSNIFHQPIQVADPLGHLTSYVLDSAGRVTVMIDALNQRTSTLYDGSGHVTGMQDANGNLTQYLVDGQGRATVTIDALSNRTSYLFDAVGNLTQSTDARGGVTTLLYDAMNRLTSSTAPGLLTTTYEYNVVGGLTRQTDALGRQTSYSYTGQGWLQATTQAAGSGLDATTTYLYDSHGNMTGTLDPLARLSGYVYDLDNRQTVTVDALGNRTTLTLDLAGNVTRRTDARGNPTDYLYDVLNRQTVTIDALGNRATVLYDLAGNLTGQQDGLGRLTTYVYDLANRQTLTIDALGGQTKMFYDKVGNVTEVRDARNNPTTYAYDALNRQTVMFDALGGQTKTFYDKVGNVTEVRDARNNPTTFAYDALSRQTLTVDALGNQTKTFYDKVGNVTEVRDARNNPTTFAYDALNRQTLTVDALGNQTKTFYDKVGNVTEVLDARNKATTFTYDALNRQTVMFDALGGQTKTFYDKVGNVTEVLDARNKATTFAYDVLNRQTVMFDALGGQTKTFYDKVGNVTEVLDARNNPTTFTYDALNRQTVMFDALGGQTKTFYDQVGNVTEVRDARNNPTTFAYDALNRQTLTVDALGGQTKTFYDQVGNVTEVRDGRNNPTTFAYDVLNRQTLTVDALGGQTKTFYDQVGNVTEVRDARNNPTTIAYDVLNRQTVMFDALGGQTKTFYDAVGNVTEVLDARNNATTYTYDALNRQTVMFDALGGQTKTFYDAVGNVTEVLDARNNATTYTYDALNRQTVMFDALGGQTKTFYDAVGNVTEVLDARNNATTFTYDALNRQTVMFDALGGQTKTFYDQVGNVTEVLDARNNATTFTYDALNRQTVMFDALGGQTKTFYDQVGNVTEVLDARNNATTYTYDALNRQTVMFDALGGQTKTFYDQVGNVTEVLDARNNATTYTYDALNRQTVMFDALGGQTKTLYDQVGNVTEVRDARNNPTTFAYDALNRQTVMFDALGNQTKTFYDAVGNVTEVLDARNNATTYAYDALNRQTLTVTAVGGQTKTFYDKVGNVTEVLDARNNPTTYTFDALNRQTVMFDALGGQTKTFYDAVGNVTEVLDARNNPTTYTFDALNRQTVMFDALGGQTKTFYDKLGNVTGVLDANGHGTSYVYDALNRQTLSIDALGKATTLTLDAVGNATVVTDASGHATSYLYDALNRQTVMIDALGHRTSMFYDAVGNLTGAMDGNRRLTRYLFDKDNRRYVTIDPLGGRTTTLFDAAGNVTAVLTQPSGKQQISFSEALASMTFVVDDALFTLATADLNNDGFSDIVGNGGKVYLNNQDGTFTSVPSSSIAWYLGVGDFDGDGRVDIVSASNSSVFLALGNGDGTFQTPAAYALDAGIGQVGVGDFNGDGKLDVAASNWQQHYVAIFLGNGDGTLGAATEYTDVTGAFYLAVGDVNNDGHDDVVVTNLTSTIYTFLANSDGTLQTPLGKTISGAESRVALADFNGDGKLDVAVSRQNTTGVDVALGNGDGTFGSVSTLAIVTPWTLAGVELVGDGNVTLAVISGDYLGGTVTVVPPHGNGTFGSGTTYGVGNPMGLDKGDFNGDGVPDLVSSDLTGDYPEGTLHIYQGTISGTHDNLTTFAYDAANRLVGQTQVLNGTPQRATFAYDSVGLLTSTTDALGRRRDMQYDVLNRLTTETWYQTGGTIVYDTRTASYDAVGNQLTATNLAGTVTMSYDALNRVTVQKDTVGQVLTFTYDAVGNATVVQDSKGGVTTSIYDGDNRLTSRQFTGNSATLREDLTYTNTGMLATLKRFSDLAATTTVATTTYLYDAADQVTSIYDYKADGSVLASFVYSYDGAHRLTRAVNSGVTTTFTYNIANELKGDGTHTYMYDGAGNRANDNYAVTSGNQVTTDGVWTYTYDASGNMTKKSQGASAETWTYGYDNKNQLLWAEDHATDGGAATKRVDFKYDYYGNRTQKAYDSNGATAGGLTTQMFAYVGGEVWADLDSGGSLTTRYLHGDQVDQLFARVDGGTPGWYLTDHLGSVRHVVNNSATMLATLTYDGWGNATTSGSVGRYQWTGREADVEIELQYNRARYYDPKMGRWISQDPLGFDAGDSNLYRYVNNQPTMATDPSGESELSILGSGENRKAYYVPGFQIFGSWSKAPELVEIGRVNGDKVERNGSYVSVRRIKALADDTFSPGMPDWDYVFESEGKKIPAPSKEPPITVESNGNYHNIQRDVARNAILADEAHREWRSTPVLDADIRKFFELSKKLQKDGPALTPVKDRQFTENELVASAKRIADGLERQAARQRFVMFEDGETKKLTLLNVIDQDSVDGFVSNFKDMMWRMEHGRPGWERLLSGIGNAATFAAGAFWTFGTGGTGSVLGGGFLMFRGAEGLLADITNSRRFTTALIEDNIGSKTAAFYEASMSVAELLASLGSAMPKAGTLALGAEFTVAARMSMSFSGGTAAIGTDMRIAAAVRAIIDVSPQVAKGLAVFNNHAGRILIMQMAAVAAGGGGGGGTGNSGNSSSARPNPAWRSSQTGNTSRNAEILGTNMGVNNPNLTPHHIINSGSNQGVWPQLRRLLNAFQIDINGAANGVGLARTQAISQQIGVRAHLPGSPSLHSPEASRQLLQRLTDVVRGKATWGDKQRAIADELANVAKEILDNKFPK